MVPHEMPRHHLTQLVTHEGIAKRKHTGSLDFRCMRYEVDRHSVNFLHGLLQNFLQKAADSVQAEIVFPSGVHSLVIRNK
jgi:hypothetical protein